jgi:hypothetical protein
VFLFTAGFPARADACSCVSGVPVCDAFWRTPLVFSGTVIEVTPVPPKNARAMSFQRRVRFSVAKVWRGDAADTIEISTGMGGGDCGFNFVAGQQYLVYASGTPGQYSTGICSRTKLLGAAAEDRAYIETALDQPSTAGRIFGLVELQRKAGDVSARPAAGYTVTLAQGSKQWTAMTGADGHYEFRGVPAGTYAVALSLPANERAYGPPQTTLSDSRGCAAANFVVIAGPGAIMHDR